MPGFIKDIGGSNRMRFTRPGTNPDNLNLDPNQVIFDSETIGNLSVLDYGENDSIPPAGSNVNTIVTTQFRTWNLSYAPMVIAQIRRISDPGDYWFNLFDANIRLCYLESSPAGLRFVTGGTDGANRQLRVRWTAFRYAI